MKVLNFKFGCQTIVFESGNSHGHIDAGFLLLLLPLLFSLQNLFFLLVFFSSFKPLSRLFNSKNLLFVSWIFCPKFSGFFSLVKTFLDEGKRRFGGKTT